MIILLKIIIILLVITFIILFLPSHTIIEYNNELKVKLKILFIPIPIYPFPFKLPKKINSSHSNNKKNTTERKKTQTTNHGGFFETIRTLKKTLKLLKLTLKKILSHIKFKTLYLNLGIQGYDPADTAIKFGQAHILINNILSYISLNKNIKNLKINIYPVFFESNSTFYLKVDLHARAIFILYEIIIFALSYAKMSKKLS